MKILMEFVQYLPWIFYLYIGYQTLQRRKVATLGLIIGCFWSSIFIQIIAHTRLPEQDLLLYYKLYILVLYYTLLWFSLFLVDHPHDLQIALWFLYFTITLPSIVLKARLYIIHIALFFPCFLCSNHLVKYKLQKLPPATKDKVFQIIVIDLISFHIWLQITTYVLLYLLLSVEATKHIVINLAHGCVLFIIMIIIDLRQPRPQFTNFLLNLYWRINPLTFASKNGELTRPPTQVIVDPGISTPKPIKSPQTKHPATSKQMYMASTPRPNHTMNHATPYTLPPNFQGIRKPSSYPNKTP